MSAEPAHEAEDRPTNGLLLDGFNHVAVLTRDSQRLHRFYIEAFGASVSRDTSGEGDQSGVRLSFINIGPAHELNVFEIDGNSQADLQTPMFGRGRIDHMALLASSFESFSEIRRRLVALGASDGFVTDFGPLLSVFFRDPDGLECEVCVPNPDAAPGVFNPPGTPSPRFHQPPAAEPS
jgi:catechol 2,3-dioxygenase-like lactoylglutathione lyase family enzyme